MESSVYGLELQEAIDEIIYILEECKMKDIPEISLIHKYHHGQVLKNYIRSDRF